MMPATERAAARRFDRPSGSGLVVAFLLSIHAGLLAYSATQHSPTHLEPAFLAAGLSHWQFGRFEMYRVNPPLPRMIAAVPVLLAGCEADWTNFYDHPGSRAEFRSGEDLVRANGCRFLSLLCLARWACIPLSLVGGYFVYCWSRALYGGRAGLFALGLWAFEPNLLAHAELVTPDAACASFGIAAGYSFWRWLRTPSWPNAGLAGVFLGLAQLSKLSWLILFGVWPLLWIAWRWSDRSQGAAVPSDAELSTTPGDPKPAQPIGASLCQLAAILSVAIYLVNACYLFDGTFTPLEEFAFVSQTLTGRGESGEPGNRFRGTVFGRIPLPLPRQFVLGFDTQKKDLESYGQPSFLRGEWKEGGWWHYYVYGLLVKVPCGIWGLLLIVAGRRAWCHLREGAGCTQPWISRDEIVLLAPAVALLVVVSSHREFNHHLRYVFPCLPPLLVFLGQTIDLGSTRRENVAVGSDGVSSRSSLKPAWVTVASLGLAGSSAVSALLVYPHHLAYFNEFVGGPANGHRHLLGSSLDWGQDLRPLCCPPEVTQPEALPCLVYYGRFDPSDLGVRFTVPHLDSRPDEPGTEATVSPKTGSSLSARRSDEDGNGNGNAPDAASDVQLPPGRYIVSRSLLSGYGFRVRDGRGGWVLEDEVKAICRALARHPVRTTLGYSLAVIDVGAPSPAPKESHQPP